MSKGDISIGIKCAPGVVGPAEADIDFDIIRNDNDTFTVKYTPPGAGSYTIMVLFADQVALKHGLFEAWIGAECVLLASSVRCLLKRVRLNTVLLVCIVQAIPMTPIRIKVDPSHDASKVKAEGPGLNRSGKVTYSAGCSARNINSFS